ncbi:MAG: alkaline phosphatase [Bacteroidales bacterium]
MIRNTILFFLLAGLVSCSSANEPGQEEQRPSNIIFLIGDGMGLSAVSTSYYFTEGPSPFDRFHEIGLINTSSANRKITDSAASGTALATGKKTYNGAIGVDTSRLEIRNITEVVSAMGWNSGVVSTSSVTHATPASFYAHVEQRGMEEEIALQLINSEIDFFAGGGIRFFTRRSDGQNLLPLAAENGFSVDTTGLDPDHSEPGQKYGFLLAPGGMPTMLQGRESFLPDATSLAIDALSADGNNFFLMVEGSQIDWAGHDNDAEYLLAEMRDFEQAIRVAMDFAEKDGNTLVVVTADHETGGATLSSAAEINQESGPNELAITFSTGGHSATLVPVFAYGPGSDLFGGIYQHTKIFHKMVRSIGTE